LGALKLNENPTMLPRLIAVESPRDWIGNLRSLLPNLQVEWQPPSPSLWVNDPLEKPHEH